jgi:hypothetical protein
LSDFLFKVRRRRERETIHNTKLTGRRGERERERERERFIT